MGAQKNKKGLVVVRYNIILFVKKKKMSFVYIIIEDMQIKNNDL